MNEKAYDAIKLNLFDSLIINVLPHGGRLLRVFGFLKRTTAKFVHKLIDLEHVEGFVSEQGFVNLLC